MSSDELVPDDNSKNRSKGSWVSSPVQLVPGRRLNGDEAWYRVNLGPKPHVLLGQVYRFP